MRNVQYRKAKFPAQAVRTVTLEAVLEVRCGLSAPDFRSTQPLSLSNETLSKRTSLFPDVF